MRDITDLQRAVFMYVRSWVKAQNTPIPKKEIVKYMNTKEVGECTTINCIQSLVKKGYIRRGYSEKASVAVYVMIRNI